MAILELVIMTISVVGTILGMYYCFFQKVKKIERDLADDYRMQQRQPSSPNRGTGPLDIGVFTISANGLILSETNRSRTQSDINQGKMNENDLPPSYEEVMQGANRSSIYVY